MLLNQIGAEGNRSAKKAGGTGKKSVDSKGFSAGCEREGRGNFLGRLVVGRGPAVRAAGAAFLGAGAERFVDGRLDGARAPAAFAIPAAATVDLFRISRR